MNFVVEGQLKNENHRRGLLEKIGGEVIGEKPKNKKLELEELEKLGGRVK